jgi:hypothetical protein
MIWCMVTAGVVSGVAGREGWGKLRWFGMR